MKASKEHRGCVLLKPEENEEIFKLIGNRCQCLAAGVVQLYLTEPPVHCEWLKKKTGVITLIRDAPKRSYFLRLYCLHKKTMLWEQELYNSMSYNTPLKYFHTFEGEDCMIAFNFANETEAMIMRSIIYERLNTNRERRQEKKSKLNVESQQRVTLPRRNPSFAQNHSGSMLNGIPSSVGINGGFTGSSTIYQKKNKRDRDQKRKLTAADIGQPSNFRHLAHMGLNANKDLEMDAKDPTLLEFFNKAGITKQHLNSRKTRDFIYNYIDEHGGLSAVQNELQKKSLPTPQPPTASNSPPPIPARTVPVTTPGINNNQIKNTRPLPPTRNNVPPILPSAPQGYRTVPSRPPLPSVPPPPPRSTSNTSNISNSSSAPVSGPPPPPLPPPPPVLTFEKNDTSNGSNNSNIADLRPQLLDAIRSGTALKKVDQIEKKPTTIPDSRNDLLQEIRQGVRLKTRTDEIKTSSSPIGEQGGLAGGLSKALAERFKQLGYSEDSQDESSDTSDFDEWDD